ncbi:MAG: restriction endonuclease [Planctomycetes bacterium]|nr:restriction endonuclease [Planctomycetota bacterium]
MAKLTMVEAQGVAELAKSLYDFLPGTFSSVTWPDVAARFCLEDYWPGGSKLPAITKLLRNTLQLHRDRFCDFIVAVVQEGIAYRIKKNNPVRRDEIEAINEILLKVQFKIPELNDKAFLIGLATTEDEATDGTKSKTGRPIISTEIIDSLHKQFLELFGEPDAQKRGYAFEKFLDEFFHTHGLSPKGSFRIVGEQTDGSFEWKGDTYLVEARWRKQEANNSDLLVLRGKCEKSDWTRGMFISINGFSDLVSETHRIGRKANLIAMSGHDLILILEKQWTLAEALRVKLRHTGETGEVYLPLAQALK